MSGLRAVLVTDGALGATDLAAKSGASKRQVDYWARQGWLIPQRAASYKGEIILVEDRPEPGDWTRRYWPASEVAVARRMATLTEAGVAPELAASIARSVITGSECIPLADDLVVTRIGECL